MKLILFLLLGIAVGIVAGLLPFDFIAQLLITFSDVFGQWISFLIPFIILFFIASGIANIGQGSGRLVGSTVGLAYASTVIAGLLAFFIASFLMPYIAENRTLPAESAAPESFFTFEIAPLMGVMTALVIAFAFGISMAALQTKTLITVFDEGKKVVEALISKALIPFLPIYIAGIFAGLSAEGTAFTMVQIFGLVLLVAITTHWLWLSVQYLVAGLASGENMFKLIKTMLPAYVTALGTMSSAATIPVTLRQARKNGVSENITNFVIPLGATIHLSGSIITIVSCSVAVMTVMGDLATPSFTAFFPAILMLGVVMVAAPGVPGGAIVAAAGVLTSILGFTEAAVGLMIALYLTQDSFGTAANVTGDGAIAKVIDRFYKQAS
ncbi:dicarboxylate/amino acid:cation symporter [Paenalkalicoccus suaedae]|uniref:Dicarboxylate/amino acid:cation symporter n=1 Tax=Paenalkalicoccus suaedae TaxID=2592382 RepID=A0A859FGH5_9BACI|nr:dicarboxylate/amino acid:cation symporter [Paenalkalicoccus suaedae]QKS71772.1 dicarboxylate/amino acid:cation symporter [Paenalkalicoccus suaedae]